jgi:hypothetical protein
MHEKQLEEKLDELISLVKSMDTKILFIQQDIEELKEQAQVTSDMVVTLMTCTSQQHSICPGGGDKSARLEEFRKETSRW